MLPLLLEPEQFKLFLSEHPSSNILLVDLGKPERFEAAHIPGAVLVTPGQTQAAPPVPGLLPDKEALTALFQSIGFKPDQHVVVYDDEGGGWAGRFIWILDEIGHSNYSYLNGGFTAWQALDYSQDSGPMQPEQSDTEIVIDPKHTVTLDSLLADLDSGDLCIWDARSPGEHSGEKKNAARAGRIPGAINYEWTDAMDRSRNLRLKPLDQLKAEITERGIDLNKRIVTHCQSHHRSGLTYLIAKLLGVNDIKAYAGSWGEWGNREDTPIEV